MSATLYVRIRGKVHGPFETDKLKRLAAAGKISRDDELSRDQQKWTLAGNVKGLFPAAELLPPVPRASTAIQAVAPKSHASPAVTNPAVAVRVPHSAPAVVSTKPCPFCAEQIQPEAKKCKHCGEILDVALRAAQAPLTPPPTPAAAPAPAVHITNVNHNVVHAGQRPRWSRVVAFILSLFIPGLGQLYKGQLLNGLVWFLVVVAGYVFFIVPGLILHVCCALGAATGDRYR